MVLFPSKSQNYLADVKEGRNSHEVLNAKHHEREAEIVAQAGRFGAITIATNMAGRERTSYWEETQSTWPRWNLRREDIGMK